MPSTSALIQCNNGSMPYLTPTLLTNCFDGSKRTAEDSVASSLSFAVNFCDAALGELSAVSSSSSASKSPKQKRQKLQQSYLGRPLSSHHRIPPGFDTLVIPGWKLQLGRDCVGSNVKRSLKKKGGGEDSNGGSSSEIEGIGLFVDTQKGRVKLLPVDYVNEARKMEATLGFATMYAQPGISKSPEVANKPNEGENEREKHEKRKHFLTTSEKINRRVTDDTVSSTTASDKVWRTLSAREIAEACDPSGDNYICTDVLPDARFHGFVIVKMDNDDNEPSDDNDGVDVGHDERKLTEWKSTLSAIRGRITGGKMMAVINVGSLEEIRACKGAGVDLVGTDICQIMAKGGLAFNFSDGDGGTMDETLNLALPSNALLEEPLSDGCKCISCHDKKHPRGYLHHLINVREVTSEILLFVHNLTQLIAFLRKED